MSSKYSSRVSLVLIWCSFSKTIESILYFMLLNLLPNMGGDFFLSMILILKLLHLLIRNHKFALVTFKLSNPRFNLILKFKAFKDKCSLNDLKFRNGNLVYEKTNLVLNSADLNENFNFPKNNEVIFLLFWCFFFDIL